MTQNLHLYLFRKQTSDYLRESDCLSLVLEREAYTPYEEVTATFLSSGQDYSTVTRIGIFIDNTRIFLGLVDSIEQFTKEHAVFVRIRSKSFTSLLTQNELEPGLHSNLTMQKLMTDFYDFPYISYENPEASGYISVKTGDTMWDGVVRFGYKITGHYPYIMHNYIALSAPSGRDLLNLNASRVLEYGTVTDNKRLISHYHMEDINGNPNAYHQENTEATASEIVRHKQIVFDGCFLQNPDDALTFRNLYSQRGSHAKYVVYDGFDNLHIGHRLTFGDFIEDETVCRIRMSFGTNGFQTKLWCYHDGFYNLA